MIAQLAHWWSNIVYKHAFVILATAFLISILAFRSLMTITVSTQLEALMPHGTESVRTLNRALDRTGSFASIQIVAHSENPETSLQFVKDVQVALDGQKWVESSQIGEDIEILEQHKLLLLNLEDLEQLEADINEAYPTIVAKQLAEILGAEVNFTLRGENLTGNSNMKLDQSRIDEIQSAVTTNPQKIRNFVSEDRKTAVLVIWPKPGRDSLSESKRIIDITKNIVGGRMAVGYGDDLRAGVAGRIANKVAQFDAIMKDLKIGLVAAIFLIAIMIVSAYRSFAALPAIFIPLIIGILWTLGVTAETIGGLNLITVFLTMILFGLGIDFGIHNFSRYREERRAGHSVQNAIAIVIHQVGRASLVAALTTSLAFFSLTLTEFRAFTEFGFIASMGIILTFLSMYTTLPALLVIMERLGWKARRIRKGLDMHFDANSAFNPLNHKTAVIRASIVLLIFGVILVPQVEFEHDIKNLESKQPHKLEKATEDLRRVFADSHDRAVIVVETQKEVVAIDRYFKNLIKQDTETPTIEKISSMLDFVPERVEQEKRLSVIRRLENRADELQDFDPTKYKLTKRYLSVEDLNLIDLPDALRRTFLGTGGKPGFLMYIYNSVTMNDSTLARQFYDDAYAFNVEGKQYYSASEGFIFVEMIALMKKDAIKAITLVLITTSIIVYILLRNRRGTIVVMAPPLLGVLITIGIMGAIGPQLSIMNMVILPSLIGIAVDNAIHIFHRFEIEGESADIPNIMNTTGRAAVLTTLTTLIGFGGMITASMGGLRSMGILAIIGFVSCLIMTWVLLPVLMQMYRENYHA